jgi:hypothetical protein
MRPTYSTISNTRRQPLQHSNSSLPRQVLLVPLLLHHPAKIHPRHHHLRDHHLEPATIM